MAGVHAFAKIHIIHGCHQTIGSVQKVCAKKRKQKMDEYKKPPIGLKPKPFHDFSRMTDILDAMDRYAKEEIPIPPIWQHSLEHQ